MLALEKPIQFSSNVFQAIQRSNWTERLGVMARKKESGLYHLVLRLPRKIQIRVGALGRQIFPSGYYVYTGSAKRGLSHRIARHLRKRKKQHWHIDYLTSVAPVERILIDVSGLLTEC